MLSTRGQEIISTKTLASRSYIGAHISSLGDLYDPVNNPDGYICMAIAENKLTYSMLAPELEVPSTLASAGYDDPRGGLFVRQTFAKFLSECMNTTIDPDCMFIGAGLTAMMEILFYSICDPGDSCLIPAPYFSGFNSILRSPRVAVVPVPVHSPSPDPGDIDACIRPEVLEKKRLEVEAEGSAVRVLLLTSPSNPMGRVYSAGALRGAAQWARDHGIHVVGDEVYVNTVFAEGAKATYTSILAAVEDLEGTSDLVHIAYGFSKDFGLAGWRVGLVHTRNKDLQTALSALAHGCEASTGVLHSLANFLAIDNGAKARWFLDLHLAELRGAYANATALLKAAGIPFFSAQACVFMILDMRAVVQEGEDDWQVWEDMFKATKVNITPGASLNFKQTGFFRLCFAYQSPEVTRVAVLRVANWFHKRLTGAKGQGGQVWRDMTPETIPTKSSLHPCFEEVLGSVKKSKAKTTLLDFGCGDGRLALELASRGFVVTGIDINEGAVREASAKAAKRDLNSQAKFDVDDVTRVAAVTDGVAKDQENDLFDIVLMQLLVSVVGGREARLRLLRNGARHLAEGGTLLVSASGRSADVNEEYAKSYEEAQEQGAESGTYLSRAEDGSVLYPTHHFTEDELAELVSAAGLKIISLVTEIETSSRRSDQRARFYYLVLRKEA